MPRRPRTALPSSGFYHVTTRGAGQAAIFLDDEDWLAFLRLFRNTVCRDSWACEVFCLMPNHYHLIVETFLERLSRGLHRLNGLYAQRFNERHLRSGHLFGDRFAAWVIRDEEHLRNACEYVLQNPVRAGLCERAADWRWSGSRASILAA